MENDENPSTPKKGGEIDLKKALANVFKGFKWAAIGILLEDGSMIPVPRNSTAITAIIEQQALVLLEDWAGKNGIRMTRARNTREYPDATLEDGPLVDRVAAVDVKTTRRINQNRVSGFTIGSYAGYFLQPDLQLPGCRIPYGDFSEHWIAGFIYDWDDESESLSMVSNIEVIIAEKWRIASRSTGTGTTKHIASVRDITRLRNETGEFGSKEAFEDFWRKYARKAG
jgi:hypothetical protein